MRAALALPLLALAPLTSGCVAKAVVDVVTLPVKAVSKGVDLATTSQSESDEKRGKALRQRDERIGKLERAQSKAARQCDGGDDEACGEAERLGDAIDEEMRNPI